MTALHFAANDLITRPMAQSRNLQRLIKIGKALYGERWQRPLAAALGIQDKQVRRYVNGESEPSDERMERLERLAQQREIEIRKARGA